MSTGMMVLVKKVINGFVRNGTILSEPVGELSAMDLAAEQLTYLRAFVVLMMETALLNRYTWIYVHAPVNGVPAAMKYWNSLHPTEQVNVKTGINAVDRNRLLLQGIFGDALETVLFRYERADMSRYWAELRAAMDKYCKDSLFEDNLSIGVSGRITVEIPLLEDVIEFTQEISPYRKNVMAKAESSLKLYHGVAEYFNYLSKKADKTEQELAWYEAMQEFLSGKTDEFNAGLCDVRNA